MGQVKTHFKHTKHPITFFPAVPYSLLRLIDEESSIDLSNLNKRMKADESSIYLSSSNKRRKTLEDENEQLRRENEELRKKLRAALELPHCHTHCQIYCQRHTDKKKEADEDEDAEIEGAETEAIEALGQIGSSSRVREEGRLGRLRYTRRSRVLLSRCNLLG